MPPTQTTAPSMCSAKASAAMSGHPVRGTIKRYYSGYTLAYASYGKEGTRAGKSGVRHHPPTAHQAWRTGDRFFVRAIGKLTTSGSRSQPGRIKNELVKELYRVSTLANRRALS